MWSWSPLPTSCCEPSPPCLHGGRCTSRAFSLDPSPRRARGHRWTHSFRKFSCTEQSPHLSRNMPRPCLSSTRSPCIPRRARSRPAWKWSPPSSPPSASPLRHPPSNSQSAPAPRSCSDPFCSHLRARTPPSPGSRSRRRHRRAGRPPATPPPSWRGGTSRRRPRAARPATGTRACSRAPGKPPRRSPEGRLRGASPRYRRATAGGRSALEGRNNSCGTQEGWSVSPPMPETSFRAAVSSADSAPLVCGARSSQKPLDGHAHRATAPGRSTGCAPPRPPPRGCPARSSGGRRQNPRAFRSSARAGPCSTCWPRSSRRNANTAASLPGTATARAHPRSAGRAPRLPSSCSPRPPSLALRARCSSTGSSPRGDRRGGCPGRRSGGKRPTRGASRSTTRGVPRSSPTGCSRARASRRCLSARHS
mmetsp:Transcript_78345/g.211993  ORF Transcript_78345/g.211993 Transcript_78345/m.211993 type:complete len:421 (-) Transcript_78345:23-1285(-)